VGVRTRRIKIAAQEGEAVYHCISRTVNGEWLFDSADKENFRRQKTDRDGLKKAEGGRIFELSCGRENPPN
jgi:hypothetical protein